MLSLHAAVVVTGDDGDGAGVGRWLGTGQGGPAL